MSKPIRSYPQKEQASVIARRLAQAANGTVGLGVLSATKPMKNSTKGALQGKRN